MINYRVMGLDPGTQITGYGVIECSGSKIVHVDNGCIVAKKTKALPERLSQIYEGLIDVLEKFKPDALAIEEVFFAKNVMSSLRLGEARGVSMLAATQKKIPIQEYATRFVKQAITGYGQATKEQVQLMVMRLLKLPEVAQVDASDALALAICHSNSFKMKGIQK